MIRAAAAPKRSRVIDSARSEVPSSERSKTTADRTAEAAKPATETNTTNVRTA